MKITRYMGAFAVIAMLAACSTDDEQGANTAANEVKIAATVGGNSIFTRSNPMGSATEQENFNENDAISVTTEGKTVIYKKTGKVWAPANAGDYLVWTGNALLVEIFSPLMSLMFHGEMRISASRTVYHSTTARILWQIAGEFTLTIRTILKYELARC